MATYQSSDITTVFFMYGKKKNFLNTGTKRRGGRDGLSENNFIFSLPAGSQVLGDQKH